MDQDMHRRFDVPGMFPWPGLTMVSGMRTPSSNLAARGVEGSRHLRCPSDAADLRVGTIRGIEAADVWGVLGGWWKFHGFGRWGGDFQWEGSPLPNPKEWNHFDLG